MKKLQFNFSKKRKQNILNVLSCHETKIVLRIIILFVIMMLHTVPSIAFNKIREMMIIATKWVIP